MINDDKKQAYIDILRSAVPEGLSTGKFFASSEFFSDFDRFKADLISYLADGVEMSIRTTGSEVSEELLSGYVDGSLAVLRNIATVSFNIEDIPQI